MVDLDGMYVGVALPPNPGGDLGPRPKTIALILLAMAAMAVVGALLGGCRKLADPTPVPTPSPSATPAPVATPTPAPTPFPCKLYVWKSHVFNTVDSNFQLSVDKDGNPLPVVGGHVTIDSTAKFQLTNGEISACDPEHPCSEHPDGACSDPRGGEWEIRQSPGGVAWDIDAPGPDYGYMFQFHRLKPGDYEVKVCPRKDALDGYGRPMEIVGPGRGCTITKFHVDE